MWSEQVFGRRKSIITFVVLTIVLCGFGLKNLIFSTDTREFFDPKDERMMALLAFEERFQPTRKVLFVVQSALPFEEDEVLREAISWLSDKVAELPEAMRVDSLSTVSYPHDSNGEVKVEPYIDYICPEECEASRVDVLSDPLVLRRLNSEDRKTLSVMGVFNIERDSTERLATIAKEAIALKREFQSRYPDLGVFLTGGIPVSQAYVAAGRRDITTLFAAAGVLLVILLRIFLGDFRKTLTMLAASLGAVIVCMGLGGWMGMELNSASSMIPIMVMTLVVASAMHLFSHFLRLCDSGVEPELAASTAVNANYQPIILTTLTSAASLASLSLISSPPVRDLGILAAIGMLTGGVFAITFIPLMLDTRGRHNIPRATQWMQRSLNHYAKSLKEMTITPAVSLIVLASLGCGIITLTIDDDFVAYLSERTEVRRDTDVALKHLAGPSHIELEITASSTVFAPAFLAQLEDLTERLRTIENVASASSLSDVMKKISVAFGEKKELGELSGDALSQYFLAYELGLRAGDSAADLVNFEANMTHIPLLLNTTQASGVRAIESEIDKWLHEYDQLSGTVTGENSPVAYLSSSNIPAVAGTVATSLILTALLLGLLFKNWRFGLNALVAIAIPIACGLGAWGWISGTIGLSGTIIVAVALGVVIDDAIHLLYQQRQSLDAGEETWESTSYAVHRVGVPIVATSIIFVFGLSPLMFSDFDVNVTFAVVTCSILAISLSFDLAILPRLMVWAGKGDRPALKGVRR